MQLANKLVEIVRVAMTEVQVIFLPAKLRVSERAAQGSQTSSTRNRDNSSTSEDEVVQREMDVRRNDQTLRTTSNGQQVFF